MLEVVGLTSLVLSLLSSNSGELLRLVRRVVGERIALSVEQEKSITRRAEVLATHLVDSELVTPKLFSDLRAGLPGNEALIDQAERAVLGDEAGTALGSPPVPPGVEPEVVPREAAAPRTAAGAWALDLEELLDAAIVEPAGPPQLAIDVAAVLPKFDALAMRDVIAGGSKDDFLTSLAAVTDVGADGRWVLNRKVRRETVRRLYEEGRLVAALADADRVAVRAARLSTAAAAKRGVAEAPPAAASPHREILEDIATGKAIDITANMPEDWLLAAREVGDWFLGVKPMPIALDVLATIFEARDKLSPLQKLTGEHFRGRVEERRILTDASGFGPDRKRVLALTGIGGVGKSALLGRVLLDLLKTNPTPPWVYLDCDRPEVDPTSARALIQLIARNLGLLYVGLDASKRFYALESASAGDPSTQLLNLRSSQAVTETDLLTELRRLAQPLAQPPSLLIVIDTLERVIVRGPAVVNRVTETISALLAALPFARVVVSGRGEVTIGLDCHRMTLSVLDAESADAVLEARGVNDMTLRHKIITAMGTSPLSLRLAGEAIRDGKLTATDLDLFAAKAKGLRLQGELYTRILGHIDDPEVRRLAHPGLVVRRVTPGVLREVLATICDLDPAGIDALFERLPQHVALFESDEAAPDEIGAEASGRTVALRHRQDLREEILELMIGDPLWKDKLRAIHDPAVAHYSGRDNSIARAEALYHRLMRDDDASDIDGLWTDDLAASLGRSWAEPFPARARYWLGIRLGHDMGDGGDDLRLIDWEVRTARRARSSLEVGNFEEALGLLGERRERTAASPLPLIEITALRRAGRPDDAVNVANRAIAETAIEDAARLLALHGMIAETALEMGEPALSQAHAHAQRALGIADALRDDGARLRALEVDARAATAAGSMRRLESAFVAATPEVLHDNAATVTQIVQTIGPRSSAVLKKAALTFGNKPEQTFVSTNPLLFTALFNEVAAQDDGDSLLCQLAVRAGMPGTNVNVSTLAANTVRRNLQGDVLATILDAYGEDDGIRQLSFGMFNPVGVA